MSAYYCSGCGDGPVQALTLQGSVVAICLPCAKEFKSIGSRIPNVSELKMKQFWNMTNKDPQPMDKKPKGGILYPTGRP